MRTQQTPSDAAASPMERPRARLGKPHRKLERLRKETLERPHREKRRSGGNIVRASARTALPGEIELSQYFAENVFVHTHVAKTGGTSFIAGLRSILGRSHVYDLRGAKPEIADMTPEQVESIWLLSGHFWFDTRERALLRKRRYFMNIRDPIDRFISRYNYVAERKNHPGHMTFGRLDIDGAYRYLRDNNPNSIFNALCGMFGDDTAGAPARQRGKLLASTSKRVPRRRATTFEEVRQTTEDNYALVIPMHRLDDAVGRLGEVLGAEVKSVDHRNVGSKKSTEISDETRQELRERNSEDYKLIAHFEAVFDRYLEDLPARLMR